LRSRQQAKAPAGCPLCRNGPTLAAVAVTGVPGVCAAGEEGAIRIIDWRFGYLPAGVLIAAVAGGGRAAVA
jgi:hypothetical protein